MDWVIANWDNLIMAVSLALGAFAIIAKLTPWGWDDKAYSIISKLFAMVKK